MPRNTTTGVYTLPVAPFVPLAIIKSADVNSDFSDIASALTQSLALNGAGQLVVNGAIYQPSQGNGQSCQLVYINTSTIQLNPWGGNNLTINGVPQTIPSSGVQLTQGSTGATFYYVYAFMNGAVMTMELSTTGYTIGSGGVQTKSGDSTRTLVGAVYTDTGGAFAQTDGKLWVLSYFNRRRLKSSTVFTADRTTASTTGTEISTEIRNQFICWSGESVEINNFATVSINNADQAIFSGSQVDGSTTGQTNTGGSPHVANGPMNLANTTALNTLTENANHFATMFGYVAGGNTGTWIHNAAPLGTVPQCQITVFVNG